MIDFNKNSFCISINDDRYKFICDRFEQCGISKPVLWRNIKHDNHKLACSIGHIACIMQAIEQRMPYCIIFEDDAYPCIDVKDKLNVIIDELGGDYDILVLGITGGDNGHRYNDKSLTYEQIRSKQNIVDNTQNTMIILHGIHGSHAYVIKSTAYQMFIDCLISGVATNGALDQRNYGDKLKIVTTKTIVFASKS